jgi:hypothetical protein
MTSQHSRPAVGHAKPYGSKQAPRNAIAASEDRRCNRTGTRPSLERADVGADPVDRREDRHALAFGEIGSFGG